ncbi:MAG: YggT family protein [Candidatus Cloacimonetes bacterium]|nr:YggT family protein [Candidatus Cloacimonadota bacterium]
MPTTLTGSILLFVVRIIQVYNLLIFGRVIASWVIRDPENRIFHFLYATTEPILGPIRKIMPQMGLDFSPIIAYFLLNIIAKMLNSLI